MIVRETSGLPVPIKQPNKLQRIFVFFKIRSESLVLSLYYRAESLVVISINRGYEEMQYPMELSSSVDKYLEYCKWIGKGSFYKLLTKHFMKNGSLLLGHRCSPLALVSWCHFANGSLLPSLELKNKICPFSVKHEQSLLTPMSDGVQSSLQLDELFMIWDHIYTGSGSKIQCESFPTSLQQFAKRVAMNEGKVGCCHKLSTIMQLVVIEARKESIRYVCSYCSCNVHSFIILQFDEESRNMKRCSSPLIQDYLWSVMLLEAYKNCSNFVCCPVSLILSSNAEGSTNTKGIAQHYGSSQISYSSLLGDNAIVAASPNFGQVREDYAKLLFGLSQLELVSRAKCYRSPQEYLLLHAAMLLPTKDVGAGALSFIHKLFRKQLKNVESSLLMKERKLLVVDYGGDSGTLMPLTVHDGDYCSSEEEPADFDHPFRPDTFASQALPNNEVLVLDSPIKPFCGLAGSEDHSEAEPLETCHLIYNDNTVSFSPPTVRESTGLPPSPQLLNEPQLPATFTTHANTSRNEPESGCNNGIEGTEFYKNSNVTIVEAVQESSPNSQSLYVPQVTLVKAVLESGQSLYVPRVPEYPPGPSNVIPFLTQADCDSFRTLLEEEETVPQPAAVQDITICELIN